jgi:hypothetical protein
MSLIDNPQVAGPGTEFTLFYDLLTPQNPLKICNNAQNIAFVVVYDQEQTTLAIRLFPAVGKLATRPAYTI